MFFVVHLLEFRKLVDKQSCINLSTAFHFAIICDSLSYAVTGAEDNKLRLWPLDFTDFLLEAQHEGCVTQIHVALDGRKLCIGTDAGTLGVLNVSEHSYSTVLRSHCGSVNQVVPCLIGAKKGK